MHPGCAGAHRAPPGLHSLTPVRHSVAFAKPRRSLRRRRRRQGAMQRTGRIRSVRAARRTAASDGAAAHAVGHAGVTHAVPAAEGVRLTRRRLRPPTDAIAPLCCAAQRGSLGDPDDGARVGDREGFAGLYAAALLGASVSGWGRWYGGHGMRRTRQAPACRRCCPPGPVRRPCRRRVRARRRCREPARTTRRPRSPRRRRTGPRAPPAQNPSRSSSSPAPHAGRELRRAPSRRRTRAPAAAPAGSPLARNPPRRGGPRRPPTVRAGRRCPRARTPQTARSPPEPARTTRAPRPTCAREWRVARARPRRSPRAARARRTPPGAGTARSDRRRAPRALGRAPLLRSGRACMRGRAGGAARQGR